MKLSERLAMAATERADAAAAGTTVERWRQQRQAEQAAGPGLRPEPDGRGTPATAPHDTAVILAPQTPVTAVDPDPTADPRSVCPTCGRGGDLGMVDLHGRTADWSCPACGTMWRVTLPPVGGIDNLPPD